MKIDFNNVRRQALTFYGGLVRTLKEHTTDGLVRMDARQIEDAMEDLRSALAGIASAYDPDDPEFQDVLGDQRIPSLFDEEED